MSFQLHCILETFSALFALEGFFVCMFSSVLVVVPFIGITVVTFTAFVHHTTVGALMFYQVAVMGEVLFTKRFLVFVFPCFAETRHVSFWLMSTVSTLKLHSNYYPSCQNQSF